MHIEELLDPKVPEQCFGAVIGPEADSAARSRWVPPRGSSRNGAGARGGRRMVEGAPARRTGLLREAPRP
jgi:hypothetical protein